MLSGFTVTGTVLVEIGSIVITDSLLNTIQVLDESTPTIKSNHITGGQQGISLTNKSKAKICNNDIFECDVGISIADSRAMIEKNNIYECSEYGILITEVRYIILYTNH
jgi:parallel beta-helix repeat protein